jgi:hypothetical protein
VSYDQDEIEKILDEHDVREARMVAQDIGDWLAGRDNERSAGTANEIHELIVEAHRSTNPVTTDALCRRIVSKVEPLLESVARATADAIADKIEAIHHEGMPARNHAMKLAANIARSHGSQAQTTEDGQ